MLDVIEIRWSYENLIKRKNACHTLAFQNFMFNELLPHSYF